MAPVAQLQVSLVALNLRFAENFTDAIPRVLPVLLHQALEARILPPVRS